MGIEFEQEQTAKRVAVASRSATQPSASASPSASGSRRVVWRNALLLSVVAVAARLWGLNFGLPYSTHPDEPVVIGTVVDMLHAHSLDPNTFLYPSGLYYYLFAVGSIYQLVTGHPIGEPPTYMALGLYPTPDAVMLMRLATSFVCALAIVLVYLTARLIAGEWPAIGGALLLAFSPFHLNLSQIVTTDGVSATCMALLAFFSALALRNGRVWTFYAAAVAAGLAAGVKYNAAAGGIMWAVALYFYMRREVAEGRRVWGWSMARDPRALSLLIVPLTFLVTTPFSVIRPHLFLAGVKSVFFHYGVQGHEGFTGLSIISALGQLFSPPEILLSALAIVGLVSVALRRKPEAIVIASGALVYFGVVVAPKLFFARNLVPLWPLLAILAAEGLAALYVWSERIQSLRGLTVRGVDLRGPLLAMLFLVAITPTVASAAQFDTYRASTDVRQQATDWIAANIPAGSTVAIESYDATVDTSRYTVIYQKFGIFEQPMSWYRAHGVQYVVISELFYRRFYLAGSAFPSERAAYDTMRAQWPTLQAFDGVNSSDGTTDWHIYVLKVV